MNHDAQIELSAKNISQIIFIAQAEFQASKFLNSKPPSSLARQQESHDTLADAWAVMYPFHKNFAHRESISLMTLFGMMKELV